MMISLILAMDENRGIGLNNSLPWSLPEDLKRFKTITMGHHIIMGRLTYQSIGKGLPGRINIVLTRDPKYFAEGCIISHSIDEALEIARNSGEVEVFIIGGGEIYAEALPLADRIYLTLVHTTVNADVYFPSINESEWKIIDKKFYPPDETNCYPTTFKILERSQGGNQYSTNQEIV